MRLRAVATIAGMLASCAIAHGTPPEKPAQLRGEGCVEPGVEARCLVVKDVRSGMLFNLFIKGVQPEIGYGIEFVGVPHRGMTTCMQGTALDVLTWAHRDLKCTQGTAPKPRP
ncbi:MAG: hypothetical protein WA354_04195 [Terracidiphilus sp.]